MHMDDDYAITTIMLLFWLLSQIFSSSLCYYDVIMSSYYALPARAVPDVGPISHSLDVLRYCPES